MLTVAVVCVAGASSTFLARRLSDIASAKSVNVRFLPKSIETIDADTADLVALTSHIASTDVLDRCETQSIRHVVLPASVRGGFGAEDAFTVITAHFDQNGTNSGFEPITNQSKEMS